MKMKDTQKLYKLIGKKIKKDNFIGTLTHITDSEFTLVNDNGVEKTFSREVQKPKTYLLLDSIKDMPQYYKEGYEITKNDGTTIYFGGQSEAKKWLVEHRTEVAPFKNATAVVKGEEPWDYIKFNVPAREASDVNFAKNQLYYIEKDGTKSLYVIKPEYVGHVNMSNGQGDFISQKWLSKNPNYDVNNPDPDKKPKMAGPEEHSLYLGTFNSDEEMQRAAEEFVNDFNKDYDAYNNAKGVAENRANTIKENLKQSSINASQTRRENLSYNSYAKTNFSPGRCAVLLNKTHIERFSTNNEIKGSKNDTIYVFLRNFINKFNREIDRKIANGEEVYNEKIDFSDPQELYPQKLEETTNVNYNANNTRSVIEYYEFYTESIKKWLEDTNMPLTLMDELNAELYDNSYCVKVYKNTHYGRNPYLPSWSYEEGIPGDIIDLVNIDLP